MELLDEHLKAIMPNAPKARRAASLPILNQVMADYAINNERRAAAWLATLAVESGELKYQQELASGEAYEGRKDLGNTQAGDGRKFKGHGRIQITGRANHGAYTQYLRRRGHLPVVNFVVQPERLAEEPYATDSAGWFWAVLHDLNSFADSRKFLKTQTTVNGRNKNGLPNHWTERKAYYERALRVLPDDFLLEGAEPVPDEVAADIDEPVPDAVLTPTEEAKGVTTGTKEPDKPTEGTPAPAKAVEIEASKPSLLSKATSLSIPTGVTGAIGVIWKFAQAVPPWGWAILGGVFIVALIVAAWLWNEAMNRAQGRTLKVLDAAANKNANNLRLV